MARATEKVTLATGNDRRTSPRYAVLRHGDVVMVEFASSQPALLLDLGADGMGLQAFGVIPGRQESTPWSFALPHERGQVEGSGTVIWSEEAGNFGIRFDRVTVGSAALNEWVTERALREAALGPVSSSESAASASAFPALADEIQGGHLSGDVALQVVVERVGAAIGASGAVVALASDGAIVCRASYGSAPEVGAKVDPHSGLTGECVRTGQIVCCDDTEADPRVNRELCRALNLRSLAVVPMVAAGEVIGIVEAFSSTPDSFQDGQIKLLRGAADIMLALTTSTAQPSKLSWPDDRPLTEIVSPGPESEPVSKAADAWPAISLSDEEVATLLAEACHEYDDAGTHVAEPVAPEAAAKLAMGELESLLDRDVGPAADPESLDTTAAVSVQDIEDQTMGDAPAFADAEEIAPAAPAPERVRFRRSTIAMVVLALVLLALGAYAIRRGLRTRAQQSNATPVPAAPASLTIAPPVAPNSSLPSSAVPPTKRPEKPSPPPTKRPPTEAATPADVSPALRPEQMARQVPVTAAEEPAAPPALGLGAAQNDPSVSSLLTRSATIPERPALVASTGLSGGTVKNRREPLYPPAARALRLQGMVVLAVTVDTSGKVVRIKRVSGHPVLANAAEAAVRQWKYEPFLLNGQAVETETTVRVNFKAP